MENIILEKNQLKILDDQVKFLINQGNWFLFEVSASFNSNINYLLIADNQFYTFDSEGNIIESTDKRPTDITYKKTVYFDDIPRAESLSNYRLSWGY
jgi:hypothetical protein